jgi:hypothetical protein
MFQSKNTSGKLQYSLARRSKVPKIRGVTVTTCLLYGHLSVYGAYRLTLAYLYTNLSKMIYSSHSSNISWMSPRIFVYVVGISFSENILSPSSEQIKYHKAGGSKLSWNTDIYQTTRGHTKKYRNISRKMFIIANVAGIAQIVQRLSYGLDEQEIVVRFPQGQLPSIWRGVSAVYW